MREWARGPGFKGLLASSVVGIILGVTGAFGSYASAGLLLRTSYWLACLWLGWLTLGTALPRIMAWAQRRGWSLWWTWPAVVALLTIPPAAVSRVMATTLWPATQSVTLSEWYVQGLFVSVLVSSGVWAIARRKAAADKGPAQSANPRDHLPARLGRKVLCLQMEDHYVRVHTPVGSGLVLMSLAQAIEGLKDVEGAQTHRSWWVARAAVQDVVQEGRNVRLLLVNGMQAPVSRTRLGTLRNQGWLAPPSWGDPQAVEGR